MYNLKSKSNKSLLVCVYLLLLKAVYLFLRKLYIWLTQTNIYPENTHGSREISEKPSYTRAEPWAITST